MRDSEAECGLYVYFIGLNYVFLFFFSIFLLLDNFYGELTLKNGFLDSLRKHKVLAAHSPKATPSHSRKLAVPL